MKSKASFNTPGNYKIEFLGQIHEDWHGRFGMMRGTTDPSADISTSILEGTVSDQTELAGILNTLYELRLTLISVQLQD